MKHLKSGLEELTLFTKAFAFYLKNLPLRMLLSSGRTAFLLSSLLSTIKFELVRKLIWSRGKRARPVIHMGLTAMIAFVLVFGGPLSSSTIVRARAEGVNPDFLEAQVAVVAAETDVLTTTLGDRGRQGPYVYTVKPGDTLSLVGEKFNISVNAIRYASGLSASDYLKVGQELAIPPVGGLWHTVAGGDTISSLASKFEVAEQAIIDSNYLFPPYNLSVGQQLVIPDAKVPLPVSPTSPTIGQYASSTLRQVVSKVTGGTVGSGAFSCPCSKLLLSQYFSWYHPAIDIQSVGQANLAITAADAGTVVAVYLGGWNYGYGNQVVVDHGNGYQTNYAHLSSVSVGAGDSVSKGQALGVMGNTGRSFGTHLHFEVEYFGKLIDPLSVL
ncbi:MAG: M23 family metallopeptidase [bacterium]